MRVPQIKLDITDYKLGVSSTPSTLSMTPRVGNLVVDAVTPEIYIDAKPADMSIDYTQAREDLKLRSTMSLMGHLASLSQSRGAENTSIIAADGDALMAIENGHNVYPYVKEENMYLNNQDRNIDSLPRFGADVSVRVNRVSVDNNVADVSIRTDLASLNYSASRADVSTYLIQKGNLNVSFDVSG